MGDKALYNSTLFFQKIQKWEIVRVINCHDASLEEELTAVYLPTGFFESPECVFCLANIDEQRLM